MAKMGANRDNTGLEFYMEQQKQGLRKDIQGVKDWMIDCLKELEMGCREGEERENGVLREQMKCAKDCVAFRLKWKRGRKKVTLRVIELSSALSLRLLQPSHGIPTEFHQCLSPVKVEEHKV